MTDHREVFQHAMDEKAWGRDADSLSGPGSSLEQTRVIRAEIPPLVKRLGLRRMLDVPCGDFFWMSRIIGELAESLDTYTGGDLVPGLIAKNVAAHATSKVRFEVLDLCNSALPQADLIMVRDCFLHLPFSAIVAAIGNIKRAGITYLLASTYTAGRPNLDVDGANLPGRALDLTLTPFLLTAPLLCINEECTEGDGYYSDKSLALWRVADIDVDGMKRRVRKAKLASTAQRIINAPRRALWIAGSQVRRGLRAAKRLVR